MNKLRASPKAKKVLSPKQQLFSGSNGAQVGSRQPFNRKASTNMLSPRNYRSSSKEKEAQSPTSNQSGTYGHITVSLYNSRMPPVVIK